MEVDKTGFTKTESGLEYKLLKEGTGKTPSKGAHVSVHYHGYLEDGTTFDNSYDRGQPINFPVGVGRVIKGWDEGIMMLKTGSEAVLRIPPHLGYGAGGAGPIPPNATLYFRVQLVRAQ